MENRKGVRLNFTLFQLKSYFKNLPFVFLFMGIFYFSFILIVYSFLTSTARDAVSFVSNSVSLIENVYHESEDAFTSFFQDEFQAISQMKSNEIHLLIDGTYLNEFIKRFTEMLNQNYGPAAQEILSNLETVFGEITAHFLLSILYLFLSTFLSDLAMKFALRYYSRKNTILKTLISIFFEALLGSSIILLLGYLSNLNGIYFYLGLFFLLLLFGILSLLFGYLLQGRKKLSVKQVVNVRNILQNYLTVALIFLLPLVIFYLLYSFVGQIFAVLLFIPLMLYSFDSIGFANENYVLGLKEKANTK